LTFCYQFPDELLLLRPIEHALDFMKSDYVSRVSTKQEGVKGVENLGSQFSGFANIYPVIEVQDA
jgi:hypothetical protein